MPDIVADPLSHLHNPDAEESLIGAVLIDPARFHDLSGLLSPSDFFIRRLGWVWGGFQRLYAQRLPLDIVTVCDELQRQGRLEEIGGPAYMTALLNRVPTSLNADAYARIVLELSGRRQMLQSANQIANLALDTSADFDVALESGQRLLLAISGQTAQTTLTPLNRMLSETFDQIQGSIPIGIPTGLTALDAMLGGLQPSDLVIVAGRPGQGKTSFLLTVGRHAASLAGRTVAVFSLEMAKRQLTQRLLAQETGVSTQALRIGNIQPSAWQSITDGIAALTDIQLFIDDTPAITPAQIRARCLSLRQQQQLDLVIVDYLQLMAIDRRVENRTQEVSVLSRSLKNLARELDVPVVAAAQLSRAVEMRADKRPVLSDLRESGSIEADADIVIFLHARSPGQTELIVAKHRNGPTGTLTLAFHPERTLFEDRS